MQTVTAPFDVEDAIRSVRQDGDDRARALGDAQRDALARLYDRYAPLARRVARRHTHSAMEAEDVVHDVFLALPRTLAAYRPGNFDGWLARVVQRAARARRRRTERECDFDAASFAGPLHVPHPAQDDPRHASLIVALEQLPCALREIVVLRHYAGLSHREIAERLGISRVASEIRLCRAMGRIRTLIGVATTCETSHAGSRRTRGEPLRLASAS